MFPISVVSQKTGLSAEVLRAWERRYNGVRPARDDRGRRMYSRELLDRLKMIARLLQAGYRIGDVVEASDEELVSTIEELGATGAVRAGTEVAPSPIGTASALNEHREADETVASAVFAALRYDTVGLRAASDVALTTLGRLNLADGFVFPVMKGLKSEFQRGGCHGSHIAFARSNLRILVSSFLLGGFRRASVLGESEEHRPRIVVATPPGYPSDLGALAAAVHVQAAGWTPVILGAEVPQEDVVAAVAQQAARGVLLTCVVDSYDAAVFREFSAIAAQLDDTVSVYFGGRMPATLVADLRDAGLIGLDNMGHLRDTLETAGTLQN